MFVKNSNYEETSFSFLDKGDFDEIFEIHVLISKLKGKTIASMIHTPKETVKNLRLFLLHLFSNLD